MEKHGEYECHTKFYYLYGVACRKDQGFVAKGAPVVTVCIAKHKSGFFFRGISVASPSEKVISKKDGRNRAYGRMIKAYRAFYACKCADIEKRDMSLFKEVSNGSAKNQIMKALTNGYLYDNWKKYDEDACAFYWIANARPTEFEQALFV